MSDTFPNYLPKDVLFKVLPASFEPWGSMELFRASPPTPDSVKRINAELGITLSQLFIEVAAACSSYGGWFNSIGDDYESRWHLFEVNKIFRDEGLPDRCSTHPRA